MADRGQMDAYLVRAPGVQVSAQQIDRLESGEPNEIGARGATGGDDPDASSIARIASERLVDGDVVFDEMAPRQRRVSPPDRSRLERGAEHAVRAVGLGDEEQPRCLLVEPVDNAFAPFAGSFGERP